jgi:hypothetical protein
MRRRLMKPFCVLRITYLANAYNCFVIFYVVRTVHFRCLNHTTLNPTRMYFIIFRYYMLQYLLIQSNIFQSLIGSSTSIRIKVRFRKNRTSNVHTYLKLIHFISEQEKYTHIKKIHFLYYFNM